MLNPKDSERPQSHWDLKRDPWSMAPRFYPPGQHPAYARQREILRKLQELPPSRERDWTIAKVQEDIAAFEDAEGAAKAHAQRYFDGH